MGKEIGRGGEGIVYHVADEPGLVAKIYHEPKEMGKLLKMVASRGELLDVAAWPLKVLAEKGKAVGFLCKKISRGKEIHQIFHPKDRKKAAPKINWDFLIHTAINLAISFRVIHASGLIVGDVNDRNILVLPNGTVYFIDCDSFHVSEDYPCAVGMALYLPPEMQSGGIISQESDHFSLAVLIFQLLFMGRHPFAGSYPGRPEMCLFQAIREGYFCFSGKVNLPLHALPFSIIPPELQQLFVRAFTGNVRPKAAEWVEALVRLKQSLVICPASHYYFGESCCWCHSEREFQIDYFSQKNRDPRLAALWEKIEAAPAPGPLPKLVIHTDPATPAPFQCGESVLAFCVLPLVSVGFYYTPYIWPLLIAAGFFAEDFHKTVKGRLEYWKRKKRCKKVEREWEQLLQRWQTEASDRPYREVYSRLMRAAQAEELAAGLEELARIYASIMAARESLGAELKALAQRLRQAKEDLNFFPRAN